MNTKSHLFLLAMSVAFNSYCQLSWAPIPSSGQQAPPGSAYGSLPVYNTFELTQTIVVTNLCYLNVNNSPTRPPITVNLYSNTLSNPYGFGGLTLITSATIDTLAPTTFFGSYSLGGSDYGGYMDGEPITPVVLTPGEYTISASSSSSDTYFTTTSYTIGTGIFVAGSTASVASPAFAYEILPTLPVLQFNVSSNSINLLWPLSASSAVAQYSGDLNSWADVPGIPNTNGSNFIVSIPMTNNAAFFRLRE
jgi:hypothetical protein